jgi:error-prone DNA polymerase
MPPPGDLRLRAAEFAADGVLCPAQIVRDAREHGVEVRAVDINASFWDNSIERDGQGRLALRLGFRQIKGLSEEDAHWLTAARGNGYRAVRDVWRRAGLGPAVLERLAEADVFAGIGLRRREALWEAKAITSDRPLPLFAQDIDGEAIDEPAAHLPAMTLGEEVVEDYVSLRLSLRAHPLTLLRPLLTPAGPARDPASGRPPRPGPDDRRSPDLSKFSFTRGNPD